MSKVKFKIIDGGKAIPIGNNLYKLEGKSHEEGGIGIELTDGNAKTIIEAERKEIFEPKAHEFRILSNSLKIGNKTPAQLAEAGYNPDIIFKAQQSINGNYGGSYGKDGLIKKLVGLLTDSDNKKENIDKAEPLNLEELKLRQAYELNKKKNSDKVEGIRKGFKEGGEESIIDIIRQKIYNNIIPVGYEKPIRRIFNALLDKGDFLFNGERPIDENGNIWGDVVNYRDDIFAEYLQIPENKRRNFEGRAKLVKSNYTPTIKTDNNNIYYKLDENSFPMDDFIRFNKYDKYDNEHTPLKLRESRITSTLPFGYNTVSRGFDNNGEYISYYDEWDLSPFNNKDGHNSNKKDNSFGIGKPVYLYNRLYLDDYYGVPEEYRGSTYLPEVEVFANDENYKNGGKINMKLKHKNKQDITDIVMNEILPHSTGKRKKFDGGGVWGTSEWSLAGNLGLNALNALGQGIIGSITSNKAIKTFKDAKSKLKKIFTPVARERIDTRVNIDNELSGIKQSTAKLIENTQANTSNKKVARQQIQNAIKQQNELEHRAYTEKYREEGNRRDMAAKLATQYNIIDNQNYIQAEREYQDKMLQLDLGIANAEISKGQTWGNAVGSALKAGADILTDYATMTNDLLKSNNSAAYVEYMKRNYGRFLNTDGTLKDKYKGNTRIENFYNKNFKPLFSSNVLTSTIIPYDGGLLT